ncbi:hypothetical protein CY34DRAFT_110043 [Suillus luteus UH-Slu-Lm8-n1]|uniref:Uncharacterized protein n=1 Tax=Suillus luteus UH-Slu-Lm8-n1 TaxID=930992 RepID=A0A0C9ZC26_9AGAM|nr:hypothetical protein CY34DRAFT_110043 [Suillus luteus UH-Slu-Lm8-n1]
MATPPIQMLNLMNLAMWMIRILTWRVQAKVLNCQLHDNHSSIAAVNSDHNFINPHLPSSGHQHGGVHVHDAGNLSIPTPWHMISQQSMQPPDPDPHSRISDGAQDIARESIHDPYDRFRLGTSLNVHRADEEDPLERFLHMTDQHNMLNTSDLLSNSHNLSPGPSSTNDLSSGSTGNSIQPLIPHSAQFDAFYPLPFPLSFAGSSQRSERHRHARPPSTMPYFIPRAVLPSEPTASSPVQPVVAAPAALLAPALPPEPMAMQPEIMPAAQCFDPTDNTNAESQNVPVTGVMQCFDTTNRRVKVRGEIKLRVGYNEFNQIRGFKTKSSVARALSLSLRQIRTGLGQALNTVD